MDSNEVVLALQSQSLLTEDTIQPGMFNVSNYLWGLVLRDNPDYFFNLLIAKLF